MKRILGLLAPMWLGFALSCFGHVYWYQWEFYAIIVPFYILQLIKNSNKEEENDESN